MERTPPISYSRHSIPPRASSGFDGVGNVIISDTVGFIRDLPIALIAAFHATLDATSQADLLVHVVDSASPAREEQVVEVNKVLER